jgi:hypothetical protein
MSHHEPAEHHEHAEGHGHTGTSHVCRVCSSPYDKDHPAAVQGFCPHCIYKILIFVVVCMVVVSYVAWYALFSS